MNDAMVAHFVEQSSARAREVARQIVCFWEEIAEAGMPDCVTVAMMESFQHRVQDEVFGMDVTMAAILDHGIDVDID